jgi:hypothetical protein
MMESVDQLLHMITQTLPDSSNCVVSQCINPAKTILEYQYIYSAKFSTQHTLYTTAFVNSTMHT